MSCSVAYELYPLWTCECMMLSGYFNDLDNIEFGIGTVTVKWIEVWR